MSLDNKKSCGIRVASSLVTTASDRIMSESDEKINTAKPQKTRYESKILCYKV